MQQHGKGSGARAGRGCGALKLAIEDASFTFRRKEDEIAAEVRLDGLYVIRTSLPKEAIGAEDAVSAYKSLSQVERIGVNLRLGWLDKFVFGAVRAGSVWRRLLWASAPA